MPMKLFDILKNVLIILAWFFTSYFIFLLQPLPDFKAYIYSLMPKSDSVNPKLVLIEQKETHQLFQLSVDYGNKPLEAYIKIPQKSEKLPAIIILGGMMTGKTAVNYAYGVDNVILAAPDYRYKPRSDYSLFTILFDLIPAYEALYMQVVDNLILLEYLNSWNKTNNKMSILGYSFGVPFAMATTSVQNKINHLALVYGGADLQFLIRHNFKLINPIIDELLVQLFWLHVMNFEPGKFAENISADSILIINGLQDEKIPESAARDLQTNINQPKTVIWLESKHVHPRNKELSLKIISLLNKWYLNTDFIFE